MKTFAVLIGILAVIAFAPSLWAQNMPTPMSAFYGDVFYSGGSCSCVMGDYVQIRNYLQEDAGQWGLQRCFTAHPGYTTDTLYPSGQYYISVVFHSQWCDHSEVKFVTHNGSFDQQVDIHVY